MIRLLLLLACALLQAISSAVAETYPTRVVHLIVTFGPASASDIAARLLAERLSARWDKPVVVENRPGGDGLVAINTFNGAVDDHTLLFIPVGTIAVHPYEHATLPCDAERDLLPIASITTLVPAISAAVSLNVNTLSELIAAVRAQPGKLNAAATPGISDLLLSGFLKSSDLQMERVPYRDIMKAPDDLAEGRIDLLLSGLTIVRPFMQTRRIKILAVTSHVRAPIAPVIPTVAEAGYPALEVESLIGLFRAACRWRCANKSPTIFGPSPRPIR